MNNKTLTIQLLIILVNMILCSCATSGLKMRTEVDSLSYAAGYCTVCEYKEQEANIFWFIKGAVPDIEKCNFDTITNVLRMAFAGVSLYRILMPTTKYMISLMHKMPGALSIWIRWLLFMGFSFIRISLEKKSFYSNKIRIFLLKECMMR